MRAIVLDVGGRRASTGRGSYTILEIKTIDV
jgi:hypothetical protein